MAEKLAVDTIRLGRINFLNTIPFYHNLAQDNLSAEIFEGTPVTVNEALRNGEIDIAPVSSIEYARGQEQYVLIPDLCIGSRDFARSVILFSRKKIESLDGVKIVLSKRSASSQALLKILLASKYRFKNEFIEAEGSPDELLSQGDAALAIGDEALFYKSDTFLYKYDLSELWWSWTGLPFCFAVWAVRKDFFDSGKGRVIQFAKQLKHLAYENMLDIEKLIAGALNITISDEVFTQIFGYLFNLNYTFDSEMRKGLERFYELSAEAGLSPAVKEIQFIEA